jgi:phosphate transporter
MASFLSGAPLASVLLAFTVLVAIVSTFISSTVAAVLLMPVVASVGVKIGHPRMLVILCALMTSGAMGLPVSSFPNANSFAQRDMVGSSILNNSHFVRAGFPVTIVVLLLVNSLGYGLCLALKD